MLQVSGLEVFYGDLQALYGITFSVQQGEVVALVGANGAGKSTTLRSLSGLIQWRGGDVQWEGRSLAGLPSHAIVERGLVQVPEGRRVFPLLTVVENLTLGSYVPTARPKRQETLERVFEMFPRLGERRQQMAGTMSGGEQQMLAIGRGLMAQPRLLMLDEPTLGLSPKLAEEIFACVTRLKAGGLTLLLVEQNVQRALEVADRAYVLENGRNALEGPAADLLTNPQVREAYLGL